MATPSRQPKTMSSRLLTMKFMQRAAATPDKIAEPPAKRARLSNGTAAIASPAPSPRSTAQAVQEALAAEEQKRAEALEREGANKGETKWYLSFRQPQAADVESPLHIISTGYAALDVPGHNEDDSEEDGELPGDYGQGRRSFGRFKETKERQQNPDRSSSESDGEEDDDTGDGGETQSKDGAGIDALIAQGRKDANEQARAERKAHKQQKAAQSNRLGDGRRKKQVNLNRISSISAGGGGSPFRNSSKRHRPKT